MELRLGLAYEDSSEASTTTEATAAMEGTTSATEETTETFDTTGTYWDVLQQICAFLYKAAWDMFPPMIGFLQWTLASLVDLSMRSDPLDFLLWGVIAWCLWIQGLTSFIVVLVRLQRLLKYRRCERRRWL